MTDTDVLVLKRGSDSSCVGCQVAFAILASSSVAPTRAGA